MVGLSVILAAAVRGLRVRVVGDRLVVRGPREEERLAGELLANKSAVMSFLRAHPELGDLDKFSAEVMLTFGGTLLRDSDGWPAGPFVPLEEVVAALEGTAVWDPLKQPCRCCTGRTWWRLKATTRRPVGPWTCAGCYRPQPLPEAIETVTVGEGAP